MPSDGGGSDCGETYFAGVRFVLFGFDSVSESQYRAELVRRGAVDVGRYDPSCTHVIVSGRVYDDPVCVAARNDGKTLVSELWIEDSVDFATLADANRILYRPVRDLNGIPGCDKLYVCLTGYQRRERDDIMKMVELIGAHFSKPLIATKITHLICYKFEGEKYELAKRVNIKLVNHRWLEDCLKTWQILPTDNYTKSGWELEILEAEAKDSEDETEDQTVNPSIQRSIAGTSGLQKIAVKSSSSELSLQTKITSSINNPSLFDRNNAQSLAKHHDDIGLPKFNNDSIMADVRVCGGDAPDPCTPAFSLKKEDSKLSFGSRTSPVSLHFDGVEERMDSLNLSRKMPTKLAQQEEALNSSFATNRNSLNLSRKTPVKLVEKEASTSQSVTDGNSLKISRKTPMKLAQQEPPTSLFVNNEGLLRSNIQEGSDVAHSLQKQDRHNLEPFDICDASTKLQMNKTDNLNNSLPQKSKIVSSGIMSGSSSSRDWNSKASVPLSSLNTKSAEFGHGAVKIESNKTGTGSSPLSSTAVTKHMPFSYKKRSMKCGQPLAGLKQCAIVDSSFDAVVANPSFDNEESKLGDIPACSVGKSSVLRNRTSVGSSSNDAVMVDLPDNAEPISEENKRISMSNTRKHLEKLPSIGNAAGSPLKRKELHTASHNLKEPKNVAEFENSDIPINDLLHVTDMDREGSKRDQGILTAETMDSDLTASNLRSLTARNMVTTPDAHTNQVTAKKLCKRPKPSAVDTSVCLEKDMTANEAKKGKEGKHKKLAVGKKHAAAESVSRKNISMVEKMKVAAHSLSKGREEKVGAVTLDTSNDSEKENQPANDGTLNVSSVQFSSGVKIAAHSLSKSVAENVVDEMDISMATKNGKQPIEYKSVGVNSIKHSSRMEEFEHNEKSKQEARKVDQANTEGKNTKGCPRIFIREPVCFLLSGHRLQRKEFRQVIRRLRGKACRDSHQWSYQATHFIVPDPVRRTEKFFAATAAGRWVLKTDYLTASNEAGKFLGEEPFEWHKNGLTEDGAINLEAPRKWRLLRERTGHGALHGLHIIIYGECITPSLDTLKRVVKAGDGTILATSPPYTRFLKSGVDFAIISPGMPRVDAWVQEFLRHEIPCVLADYLVEYVCKPGYSLDRHVLFNTHAWAGKSFANLLARSEEIVSNALVQLDDDDDIPCAVCGSRDRGEVMMICGDERGMVGCGVATHIDCCNPPLEAVPEEDWFCQSCSESRIKSIQAKGKKKGKLSSKRR